MKVVFLLILTLFPAVAFALGGDPFADSVSLLEENKAVTLEEEVGVWQHLQGWLESRNQIRLSDGRAISTRQRLWLEGGKKALLRKTNEERSGKGGSSARFFLSGSLDFDPAAAGISSDHSDFSLDLQEAYLTLEGNSADFLLGQKMVRWGTSDGINPLDLINPLDQRDPLASGRSDNRLPVFLVQSIFALPAPAGVQEFSLEAVVVPLARGNQLNGSGSAWEPQGLKKIRMAEAQGILELAEQEKPESWFEDGKYTLRLTATTGGWDFGVIGYSGVRNSPVFIGNRAADGSVTIIPEHLRITAFGLNFAKGLKRSTLRGELVIKPDYPLQKESFSLPDYREENMVEGVIGFDRTFGLNRYLNLQYFASFIPENDGLIAHRYEHGITYEISDLFFQDDLKLGISGIVGFSGQGWIIQPCGEYKIGDNWLLAVSFFLFEGDHDGSYGQFDGRDFVTLRLRWSF